MALYIASVELLEGPPYEESSPAFNLQQLSESDEKVRRQFSKPHVAYLGAHTGCSCGFSYGQSTPESEEETQEELKGQASVRALRDFLERQLMRVPEVELFACWEGDECTTAEQRLTVTPDYFGGEGFALPEKVFYTVGRRTSP
jgi:hypothetical protein